MTNVVSGFYFGGEPPPAYRHGLCQVNKKELGNEEIRYRAFILARDRAEQFVTKFVQ